MPEAHSTLIKQVTKDRRVIEIKPYLQEKGVKEDREVEGIRSGWHVSFILIKLTATVSPLTFHTQTHMN